MRDEDESGALPRRSNPSGLTIFGLPPRPRLAAAIWAVVLLVAGVLRVVTSSTAGGRAIGAALIAISALSMSILRRTRPLRSP